MPENLAKKEFFIYFLHKKQCIEKVHTKEFLIFAFLPSVILIIHSMTMHLIYALITQ